MNDDRERAAGIACLLALAVCLTVWVVAAWLVVQAGRRLLP